MSTYNTYLFDEVDYGNVKDVIADLNTAIQDSEIEKIVITMCSWGGYYYPAFALYDHITACKKEVEIIASGVCESAALMILQAADKRIATPNTIFLIHETNHRIEDKNYSDVVNQTSQFTKEYDKFIELTVKRSTLSVTALKEFALKSTYLDVQAALKLNFIDEVIP